MNDLYHSKKYFSIYKGRVADRNDPNKMGRIKVIVPPIFGDEPHDYWAEPKGMFTGNRTGAIFIPKVDDLVWVTFENGDARYPVWEYGPYQEMEAITDLYDDNGEPTRSVIQTTSGHRVVMDDLNEYIEIKDKHGNTVTLNKYGISLKTDKISLGQFEGSAEPAVLGDKNEKVHNDTLNALITHTHMTAMGPSGVPINVTQFQQILQTTPETKSKHVSLD
jgi:uncharacterized protein involved in type VI secretion and phage assembly